MTDKKISELTELPTVRPDTTDYMPIVDVTDGVTKKATYGVLTNLPYGCFSDSTTQTIANVTTAYPITFNTDEAKVGITHSTTVNSSRIYVDTAGTYLITFSAIGKSAVANKTLDIWLAVDGENVLRSNTISKFVGSANERIITVTYIYTFTANQYFELKMASNDTGTVLIATGIQADPTRPACPSVILTVNKISN